MLKPIPFGFETPNGFFYKHKLQSSQECFLHISSSLVTSPRLAFYRVNKVEGEVFGYKKKKKGPQDPPLRPSRSWVVFLQEPQRPQCKIN